MDDKAPEEAPRNLLASLGALFVSFLALLQTRAELAATELEEESSRLVRIAFWGVVAALAIVMGLALLGTALLLAVPPDRRAITAGGVGVLFLIAAVYAVVSVRRIQRAKPRLFDASLSEIEKDLDRLGEDR